MDRKPKLGEQWLDEEGALYTCIDEIPDAAGEYGWEYSLRPGAALYKSYRCLDGLQPPDIGIPFNLREAPWFRVEDDGTMESFFGYETASKALTEGLIDAVGVINVLTGEWIPR